VFQKLESKLCSTNIFHTRKKPSTTDRTPIHKMALALKTRAVDFDEVIDSFDFVEHVTELTVLPLSKCANTQIYKYKGHTIYIYFFQ